MTEKSKERKTIEDYNVGDRFLSGDGGWSGYTVLEVDRKTKTQLVMTDGSKYKPRSGDAIQVIPYVQWGNNSAYEFNDERKEKFSKYKHLKYLEECSFGKLTLDQMVRIKAITLEVKNDN